MKKITWGIVFVLLALMSVSSFAYENVALGKKVFYDSSYESDGWHAKHLTDGDYGTYYSSNPYDRNQNPYVGYSVGVDLGQEHYIDRVVIVPTNSGSYFPADFEIWRSFDGVNYEKMSVDYGYTGAELSGRGKGVNFKGFTARYISLRAARLVDKSAVDGYLLQLGELEVYGTTDLTPKPSPNKNIVFSVFWPPTEEHLNAQQFDYLKDAEIDLLEMVRSNAHGDKAEASRTLELAEDRDIKLTYYNSDFADLQTKSANEIALLMEPFTRRKGVAGFYIKDEPMYETPMPYAFAANTIYSVAPNMIGQLNLSGYRIAEFAEEWLANTTPGAVKYLAFDVYPYYHTHNTFDSGAYYARKTIADIGKKYGVETACYIQTNGTTQALRNPSVGELRYDISLAIAFGYKNIRYFTWMNPTNQAETFTGGIIAADGTKTQYFDIVKAMNNKIHAMGETLALCEYEGLYTVGSFLSNIAAKPTHFPVSVQGGDAIVSILKNPKTGQNYFILVNRNVNSTVAFTLVPQAGVTLTEMHTDAPIAEDFQVTLSAGDFAMYLLSEGYDFDAKAQIRMDVENLAFQKPVYTSSSVCTTDFSMHLTDGKAETVWQAANLSGEVYAMVDLKKEEIVSQITIRGTGTGFPTAYQCLISTNGSAWTEVGNTTSVIQFAPQSVRYIKFVFNGFSDSTLRVAEIEASNPQGMSFEFSDESGKILHGKADAPHVKATIASETDGIVLAVLYVDGRVQGVKTVSMEEALGGFSLFGLPQNQANAHVALLAWQSTGSLCPLDDKETLYRLYATDQIRGEVVEEVNFSEEQGTIYEKWLPLAGAKYQDPVTSDGWLQAYWNPATANVGYAHITPYCNVKYSFSFRLANLGEHASIALRAPADSGNYYGDWETEGVAGIGLAVYKRTHANQLVLCVAGPTREPSGSAAVYTVPMPEGFNLQEENKMEVYDLDNRIFYYINGAPVFAVELFDMAGDSYTEGAVYDGSGKLLGRFQKRVPRYSYLAFAERTTHLYIKDFKIEK